MKLVGLVSGGKDGCFSLCKAVELGHSISCLAQLTPPAGVDELDSYMYQTVGHEGVCWVADAIGVPLLCQQINGTAIVRQMVYEPDDDDEVEDLSRLLKRAVQMHGVEAVSVGAIESAYQRSRVASVCDRLDLEMLAPLWRRDQTQLLTEMIGCGVSALLVKTASLGLQPTKHLGQTISQMFQYFLQLHSDYGFNVCGEGGEYETFVLDCPLFRRRLHVGRREVQLVDPNPVCPVGYLRLFDFSLQPKATTMC